MLSKNREKFYNVRANLHTIIENSNINFISIELKEHNIIKENSLESHRIF